MKQNRYVIAFIAVYICWIVLLAVVSRTTSTAQAATAHEAEYAAWSYPIPVEPDTQSGAPFLDGQGRVFSVVRDDARLKVYRDDVLVLSEVEAYGAPVGQIRNDGCLYVSALRGEKPRVEWRVYRVPTFACVRFITPVETLPMIQVGR